MWVRRGVESTTTAIAALCLSLALSLAGCASPGGGVPVGPLSTPAASQGYTLAPQAPAAGLVPMPRPAPPASINEPSAAPLATAPSPGSSAPKPSSTQNQTSAASGTPNTGLQSPVGPSTTAEASSPQAASSLPDTGALPGPAVYFVAIGDAGSRGVRFGCDDSLVAVQFTAPPGTDPLAAAMGQLLAPDDAATGAGLYNALSGSALRYVSGYLDGSTAVVNLSGSLRPGGVCDNPRIETQLTQTAVAATGASQAAIYIDGTPLTDLLSLR